MSFRYYAVSQVLDPLRFTSSRFPNDHRYTWGVHISSIFTHNSSSSSSSLSALSVLCRPGELSQPLALGHWKGPYALCVFQLVRLSRSGIAGRGTRSEVPVRWRSERKPIRTHREERLQGIERASNPPTS